MFIIPTFFTAQTERQHGRAVAIVLDGLQRVGHAKTDAIAACQGTSAAAVSRQFTEPDRHIYFDGLLTLPAQAQASIIFRWAEDIGLIESQSDLSLAALRDALSLGLSEFMRRKRMAKAVLQPAGDFQEVAL